MGARGHAFISHTKALSPPAQLKDGGYGPPPHPLAVRTGQRFWPLTGRRKRPFAIRSIDETSGVAVGRRLDGAGETVRLTVARLLATGADGQGEHYRFYGFLPRRYATWATVDAIEGNQAVLVLPEWHPRRPARYPARLLPEPARQPGSWLRCTADLSRPRAAQLGLTGFRPAADPGPRVCHRPAWAPQEPASSRPAPETDHDPFL